MSEFYKMSELYKLPKEIQVIISARGEGRINFLERIKLVNRARDKAVKEFAEKLRKSAKPVYTPDCRLCIDVAQINEIEQQMLNDMKDEEN